MAHTRVAGVGAGGGAISARPWLAGAARAGLVRPPIPQAGLAGELSIVGGSLAPPAASPGGTARQAARPGRPTPRADVDGLGGSSVADISLAGAARAGLARPSIPQRRLGRGLSIVGGSLAGVDWVERIAWFGEGR